MLERYKLRLGDGTVLGVDHEGLRTWAIDGKAMVQAADSHQWYPLKEFLAAEYVAARRAARQKARSREAPGTAPRPLPLVYPKPRGDQGAPPAAPTPPELPPFIAESPEIQPLAEPPARPESDLDDPIGSSDRALPVAPIKEPAFVPVPTEEPADVHTLPEESPRAGPLPAEPVLAPDPGEDLADEPVLAEAAPAAMTGEVAGNPEPTWIPDDGLPALPLPLDDDGAEAPATTSFSAGEAAEPLFLDTPPGVQALADEPTTPRRTNVPQASRPSEDAPWIAPDRPGAAKEAWRPGDELPLIPLKPLVDEAPPARLGTYEGRPPDVEAAPVRGELEDTLVRWLARGFAAYDAFLTGWISRLAQRKAARSDALARRPPGPLDEPALPRVTPKAPPPPSHEPLKPPPALRDLPILRFADLPEAAERGDVYETEGRLVVVWRWTKRIAVTSALLAGGLFAALRWESWAPGAERLGQAVLSRIERAKVSKDEKERQGQALQEATERLPHLAPQTIRLLLSTGPSGVLDPPELFRIASDAADRGEKTLTAGEARELKELRGEVLKALRSSERGRVREYDTARARRHVFPFESVDVLELFGRGAYALPPPRRERLQELLAKTITAGLEGPSEAPPGSPAKP